MIILLYIINWVVFIALAICILYLLFYAIASHFYKQPQSLVVSKKDRFAIIFPAYKEDSVIIHSINSFLEQTYPKSLYDIIVVSDHMSDETNLALQSLPITVLIATYSNSSKAKALKLACSYIHNKNYDGIVIMDADNTTVPNFLESINAIFNTGKTTIQACRVGIKATSKIAILDTVGEEINNRIFRSGHNAVGLSSALSGSGMVFDSNWFINNVKQLHTAGEDKELELLLLRQKRYITYLSDLPVYDEKTTQLKNYENQRRRWIAVQYGALVDALQHLPSALIHGNINYCDKVFQWMLPPRLIQLFLLLLFTAISLFCADS